jgi:hypothetical protein
MKFVTVVSLWLALLAASARGEGVLIANPLEAFVYGKYDLGDEYFISGNQNTFIFRCVLTERQNGIDGIALSEISIWGNHGGPWEIFRKKKSGSFAYVGTRSLTNTACLEACRSKDYLATGNCDWQPGWPKQQLPNSRPGPPADPK